MPLITSVRSRTLPDPYNPILLVEVSTDDGLTGTGETWWGAYMPHRPPGSPVQPFASMVDDVLAPVCIGRDPTEIEELWQELYRVAYGYGDEGIALSAISGIDIALWDLVGQKLEVPVVELLGGAKASALPAYASLGWLGSLETVLTDARRAVKAGFRAVKLHEKDPEIAAGARRELGPDVALMFDVNAAYDFEQAIDAGRVLADAGFTWFEEPIWPPRDHGLLAHLAAYSSVSLAAGEHEGGLEGFRRLLETGAIDYLQPEIVRIGGFTQARHIGDLAEQHDIALCPHNFSLGPSWYASLHWAASSPATRWVEVPWLPEGQEFPTGWSVPEVVDGMVVVPEGAGLCLPPLP